MPAWLATLRIVSEIAFRNLFASRWKTLIVGGIIGFGALLVVVGTSLLDGVDRAMRRSITGSIAGHIQVYSSKSKDDLEIMGGFGGEASNLDPLEDFARIKRTLLKVPNVVAVVPMGLSSALVSAGNTVDQALTNLRVVADARLHGDSSPELARKYEAQKSHVRQIVSVLRRELDNAKQVSERLLSNDELAASERAASDAFWSDFDKDPLEHLEFLENRIAALASDADLIGLRYVGTDPSAFARAFDRMHIVDGTSIPVGKRGFLFSKYVYEEQIKLKAARGLDKLRLAIDDKHSKIAQDPDLQRIVRENTNGTKELLLQLDAIKTARFRTELQGFLGSSEPEVSKLLALFFATDDANFHERYAFFYDKLAPELELYRVRVGDTLTVKAFTRSGYVQSANLKVYGTYTFTGLEKSPQAGAINMMDLVSFRELYGFMTTERASELASMRAAAGAKDVSRDTAEAELFGSKPADDDAAAAAGQDNTAPAAQAELDQLAALRGTRKRQEEAGGSSYDPKELEEGVMLNAAVLVKDERKIPQTIIAIERASTQAGLSLKVISWQKAAGLIGQFATLMQAVLFAAVLIIFVVALVVINNALVMATLERVREIGTLRAVGAQRRFILAMIVLESIVIGISSGALGALIGGALLLVLGKVGIPAVSDVMSFFFSGPRLYPSVGVSQLVFALVTVLVVSVVSGIYPAWLAMRVSPREAMQSED
jgi:ABC-type lipoprotein release transport system permease subunit